MSHKITFDELQTVKACRKMLSRARPLFPDGAIPLDPSSVDPMAEQGIPVYWLARFLEVENLKGLLLRWYDRAFHAVPDDPSEWGMEWRDSVRGLFESYDTDQAIKLLGMLRVRAAKSRAGFKKFMRSKEDDESFSNRMYYTLYLQDLGVSAVEIAKLLEDPRSNEDLFAAIESFMMSAIVASVNREDRTREAVMEARALAGKEVMNEFKMHGRQRIDELLGSHS